MGIYDQSFLTPLPNTDIQNQLIALSMRNRALNPQNIINGLGEIGKVFTDAEEEQQKANTAILQRRLDMLTPAQIEELAAQGIDPVTEAYKRGIPINVDDAAINKAWRDNIVDAQKERGNWWVSTVLPTIPHEDKLKLLKGDKSAYTKYGLTDFMRMTPELRTFIYDALKETATAENERRYYINRKSPAENVAEGALPSNRYFNDPNWLGAGTTPVQVEKDDTATKLEAENQRALTSFQGVNPPPELGERLEKLGSGDTVVHASTRQNKIKKEMDTLYGSMQAKNHNLDIDTFLDSAELDDYLSSRGYSADDIDKAKTEFQIYHFNPDNAEAGKRAVELKTPVHGERVKLETPEDFDNLIARQEEASRSGNSEAALDLLEQLTTKAEGDISSKYHNELYKALRNGESKTQIGNRKTRALNSLMKLKDRISPKRYEYYRAAINKVFKYYEDMAGDNEGQIKENQQQLRLNASERIKTNSQSVIQGQLRANKQVELPQWIKDLKPYQITAIKNAFFKAPKLRQLLDTAGGDDQLERLFIWQALRKTGFLDNHNNLSEKDWDTQLSKNQFYETGIQDQNFADLLESYLYLDPFGSAARQNTEDEVKSKVADGSIKQVKQQ